MPPILPGTCQYYIVGWYLVYFPVSSDLMRWRLLLSFHTSQGDFALLCHRELNTIWEKRDFLMSIISYVMFKKFKSHTVRLEFFLLLSFLTFSKFCLGLFWVKDQSSLKVFSNGTLPTPAWTTLTWDHLLLANHSILHEPAKQEAIAEGFWVCLQKLSFTRLLLMSTHRTARCLTPLWQVTEHCKYNFRVRDEKNGIQWRLAHRLYH